MNIEVYLALVSWLLVIMSSCMMKKTPELILALDVDSFAKAKRFVNSLYPKVKIFKVGLQLFTACGDKIIKYIQKKGAKVFLDLKFFDIPNTVANASKELIRLRTVRMFTVHCQGGLKMLQKTRQAVQEEAHRLGIKAPLIIGVTVLTSQENKGNILDSVLKLAQLAKQARLSGVVSSVNEARAIRKKFGKDFVIVTPGIRLPSGEKGDQKRTATAEEAIRAGSDYLVIGRPVLEAEKPLETVEKIINEMKL